jgi:hypothetical protein
MIFESTITKTWEHPLEDGTGTLVCFTLDDVSEHAFHGASDWTPLLTEAVSLRTRVRLMCSEPEIRKCADPSCGDGCCEDPDCTNVPEEERRTSFLLRADTIEWL